MPDEGGGTTVEVTLAALRAGASDDEVLDLVQTACVEFVSEDLIHRLVPHATRLAELDYQDHPWAALPAGVAVCAVDRPLGRSILRSGRERLEALDARSAALAWFLEGLQDMGEGDLDGATAWWSRAHASLDPSLTATRLTLAHLALGAYERGSLDEAIVLAQEALWTAEQVGDARTESLAAIYLAFFHLYTGRFALVDGLTERARRALDRLAPSDRYELPLVGMEQGALAMLRGDAARSEDCFDESLGHARDGGNEWYTAIALTIRADFTCAARPDRAVADAREALDRLDPIDESWWSRWARLALARAHLETDNLHAGRHTCRDLLAADLNPLERGRTLLVLATIERAAGDEAAAGTAAAAALGYLTDAGADFWAAMAQQELALVDRSNAEFHRRAARRLAGADVADRAWTRMLRGPGTLRIGVLGEATVSVDGTPVHFPTRAELEVVAMLVCADGPVRTSVIGDRLWPDDEPARVAHRVDNLVSSIRRTLRPTSRLQRQRGMLSIDLDTDECDLTAAVARARELVAAGTAGDRSEVMQLSELLRRPLLCDLGASWAVLEQERLEDLADEMVDRAAATVDCRP